MQNEGPVELPALFVEKHGLQITATLGKILPEDPHHLANGELPFSGPSGRAVEVRTTQELFPPALKVRGLEFFSLER